MTYPSLDLTIDDALADSVIGAAMRADRVDPKRFEALLRTTARELAEARARPRPGAAPREKSRAASWLAVPGFACCAGC